MFHLLGGGSLGDGDELEGLGAADADLREQLLESSVPEVRPQPLAMNLGQALADPKRRPPPRPILRHELRQEPLGLPIARLARLRQIAKQRRRGR